MNTETIILDTTNFRHVPEMSSYNHNVYTDGTRYILEENNDELPECLYSELTLDSEGNIIDSTPLGMAVGDEENPDSYETIFDIRGIHQIHPDWF